MFVQDPNLAHQCQAVRTPVRCARARGTCAVRVQCARRPSAVRATHAVLSHMRTSSSARPCVLLCACQCASQSALCACAAHAQCACHVRAALAQCAQRAPSLAAFAPSPVRTGAHHFNHQWHARSAIFLPMPCSTHARAVRTRHARSVPCHAYAQCAKSEPQKKGCDKPPALNFLTTSSRPLSCACLPLTQPSTFQHLATKFENLLFHT